MNAKPFCLSKNGVDTGVFNKKVGNPQANQLNYGGNAIHIVPQNND